MYETRYYAGNGLANFGSKALNWWNKRSDAQKGAIIGGVAGAGIGAAKKGVKGAVIGAAGGAAVGAGAGMAYKKWGNGALKNAFGKSSTGTAGTTGVTSQATDDHIALSNKNRGKSQFKAQKNRAIRTGESRIYGKGNQSDSMKRALNQGVNDVTTSGKTGMTRLGYGTDISEYANQNKLNLSKAGDVITKGNGAQYQKYVDANGKSYMHQISTGKFSQYLDFIPTKMFSKYFPVVKTYRGY